MSTLYSPSIVTDGLVLHLDAANKKSYSGSGTTWYDRSGRGDDLTGSGPDSNTPTFDSSNSSISFGGNGEKYQSNTNCGVVGDQTLEAVFYEDAGTAPHTTIMCTDINYQYGIKLMSYKNSDRYGLWIGFGSSSYLVAINETLVNDVIYHLLGTYKASSGEVKIYLNGILKKTETIAETGDVSLNSGNITLGIDYHGNSSNYSLNGNIFLSRVYNKTLTSAEVLQNFNATKSRFGL